MWIVGDATVRRIFDGAQPYLETLYETLFAIAYYGLFRIGEVCKSNHVAKAAHVHLAVNKEKIMIILYSSKMHTEAMQPQKIKITSNKSERLGSYLQRHFCPFQLINKYIKLRKDYCSLEEQFFVFADGSAVMPNNARNILKLLLTKFEPKSVWFS